MKGFLESLGNSMGRTGIKMRMDETSAVDR